MLNELTENQIKNMSLSELVHRMDQIRLCAHEERHRHLPPEYIFPPNLVNQFMETSLISCKDEQTKRRLADCAFRYLFQMDLVLASLGIWNRISPDYDYTQAYWSSPTYWLRTAALDQYHIIGSRIVLECFFDLIYIVDTGKRMDGKSKFGTFKKWIKESKGKDNPYIYFVGHIARAYEFDRDYRQKEVHGTSRFVHSILKLQKPDSSESDMKFQLTNILSNIWPRLLEILDGNEPNCIGGVDEEFANRYFSRKENPDDFFSFVCKLMDEKFK